MTRLNRPIRVVIVDDSLLIRMAIKEILASDPGIEVIGEAKDGVEAVETVKKLKPDVLLLDIILPRKDGITVLKEIMEENPLPVVVFSSLTRENAEVTLEALELGAFDFLLKPGALPVPLSLEDVKRELIRKVRMAAHVGPIKLSTRGLTRRIGVVKSAYTPIHTKAEVVAVIGASTGGPSIVRYILSKLPPDLPAAVLVVQHMPPLFTKIFVERLDKDTSLKVKEASEGDRIMTGVVYVAPGDYHMKVRRGFNDFRIKLTKEPKVHGVRPSVDVTLKSVALTFGSRSVVTILTGLGCDGAEGALAVKRVGGFVIAQDEASSVVYGMPKAVVDCGAADAVMHYKKMPKVIANVVNVKKLKGGYSKIVV